VVSVVELAVVVVDGLVAVIPEHVVMVIIGSGVLVAAEPGVAVLAEVDVEVEEPTADVAVMMPVEGRVGAETRSRQRDQRHQQRTEPPDAVPEPPTQTSQHQLRIVLCPMVLRRRRSPAMRP